MALELKTQLKLSQKLAMTQQMKQAIQILQLNHLELVGTIQAELERNPALEEGVTSLDPYENKEALSATLEKNTPEIASSKNSSDTSQALPEGKALAETDWEAHENNFDADVKISFTHEFPSEDSPSQFDFISEEPGLAAHLRWQLAHENLDQKEMERALFIIGSMDRNGFIDLNLEQIMELQQCSFDEAEYILCDVIQMLDPAGIGARSVRESLSLQLERLGKKDSLAMEIVQNHIDLLETKDYRGLSKRLKKKKPEIERAVHFIIDNLMPYPGLPYSTEPVNYIIPDVYVRKIDGEYIVQVDSDALPQLQLSSTIKEIVGESRKDKKLIKNKDETSPLAKGERRYLQEKLKDAEWFLNSLHQRQQTIFRVMTVILDVQYDFFEKGPEYLKPLILQEVANILGMHESTISRVTSNKYVHTSRGIFELKYFFSSAVPQGGGDVKSSESIKAVIKKIIAQENKAKPLSDNAIVQVLEEKNIKIARRTVAKYREQLDIPPVKLRRKR